MPIEKNEDNNKTVEYAFEDCVSEALGFENNVTNIGFNRGKYT